MIPPLLLIQRLKLKYFIQNGEGRSKKLLLPVSFLKLLQTQELVLQTFWLLVLTLLQYCCKISKSYLKSFLNYWTWTKTTPKINRFFSSNSYKTEVILTSFIQMLTSSKLFPCWLKQPLKIPKKRFRKNVLKCKF